MPATDTGGDGEAGRVWRTESEGSELRLVNGRSWWTQIRLSIDAVIDCRMTSVDRVQSTSISAVARRAPAGEGASERVVGGLNVERQLSARLVFERSLRRMNNVISDDERRTEVETWHMVEG